MSRSFRSIRRQVDEATGQLVRKTFARRGEAGALRQVQRLIDEQVASLPREDRSPVACQAGCDFCCHLRVMATPVEVFALLDYIQEQFSTQDRELFEARVLELDAQLRELAGEHVLSTNLACPVLDATGRCRAYAARPLNCRSYHSVSRQACEVSFNDPGNMELGHPQYTAVAKVHEGAQGGMIKAFAAQGRDARQYELVSALAEALTDSDAKQRYQTGKTAFLKPLPIPN
jgi:Fe-S-cluster containining protein